MSCYRQFSRDHRTGRFLAADALVDCHDDAAALRRMDAATETMDLELWDGARLVAVARHDGVAFC